MKEHYRLRGAALTVHREQGRFASVISLQGQEGGCAVENRWTILNCDKSFRGWGRGGGDPFAKGSLPHKVFSNNTSQ